MTKKKKILLVSDSPYATTGLGRMSRYFLKMLPEFDWTVWGFFHNDFHFKNGRYIAQFPKEDFEANVKMYAPLMFGDDHYGLEHIPSLIKAEKPDFVITSMDYDRILKFVNPLKELQFIQDFKWINYFPIDREDFKSTETDALRFPDVNVCITKFGVNKINELDPHIKIEQIYHPIDIEEFPKLDKKEVDDFKMKSFSNYYDKMNKDTFVMGTINRSFARKDTARLVTAFSKFLSEDEDSFAYVHGAYKTFEGIDLIQLGQLNGAQKGRLSFMQANINEIQALPQEILNKIYRSLDLFVTVSAGEGFGFTTVEALLTETPIIAPENTSFPELVQDFGYLLPITERAFHYNQSLAMWPIVNLDSIVDQIKYVKENKEEAKAKAKEGSKWVKKNLSLDNIAKQWRKILK